MSDETTDNLYGAPASYPRSSASEVDSRDVFHRLLNRQFVKGDIAVMEKTPNWDGILELVDELGRPVGKVEIQLKTLRQDFSNAPKHPCERAFFAYFFRTPLPLLLVVVDRQQGKAYWRHIDHATVNEVKERINGESYLLPIPVKNCLDGKNEQYIAEWSRLAKEASRKAWNFDSEANARKELEEKLQQLQLKFQTPVNLRRGFYMIYMTFLTNITTFSIRSSVL